MLILIRIPIPVLIMFGFKEESLVSFGAEFYKVQNHAKSIFCYPLLVTSAATCVNYNAF